MSGGNGNARRGMQGIPVGIAGLGHAVPDWVIDNAYFTRFIDTSDEWIQQRTGIKERRWIRAGEHISDFFVASGRKALERAGVAPEEVDLVIIGSVSGDYSVPSTACVVQDKLGCTRAAAFDVAAACTGFLYSLSIGAQFIATGCFKNVLVMGGEALSRISDIYDRTTVVLFGDGTGAALLQPHEVCGQGLIEDVTLGSDGSGWHYISRPKGGSNEPVTPEILAEGTHLLRMKGREVYRFAVAQMESLMTWAMADQDPAELGLVLPHQMNRRILETATERLSIPKEKVYINIERMGNTSAAAIPICFSEAWERQLLEKDKLLVLAAFGAGLTWGAARVRW